MLKCLISDILCAVMYVCGFILALHLIFSCTWFSKAKEYSCTGVEKAVPQLAKIMEAQWEAKKADKCLKELPFVRKCFAEKETAKTFGMGFGSPAMILGCEAVVSVLAEQGADYIAKKCEANKKKVQKDISQAKQLCKALVAL